MAKQKKKELPEPTKEQIEFIRTEHAAVEHAGQSAFQHAMACGVALLNIKKHTKHGKWEDWVQDVAAIPIRTANRYKWMAENQVELEKAAEALGVACMTVRGAPELLEEYKLNLMSEADRKAAGAKKAADQAQKVADQEKTRRVEIETAAKEYIDEHPELKSPA